jgi:medium-chain acyl-[acyl-carrier-protein] hydrolase
MMDSYKFDKEYTVPVYDTGPDGKLSLFSLFNYFQDIASEHAARLNFGRDDLMKDNRIWVLSRIFAEIDWLPDWGEKVIVSTSPRGTDKLFAIRDYRIILSGGKQIATASSSWLVIDRTTKRVQRPDDLLTRFNHLSDSSIKNSRVAGKVDPVSDSSLKSSAFLIKISDLDVNLHTNNVGYIKWVCDTYDLDFFREHSPISVEINYLAESVWGEEVLVITDPGDKTGSFTHSVIRHADNKELCRIRIIWKNCSH